MLKESDITFIQTVLTFWDHLNPNQKTMLLENATPISYKRGENIHRGENDCVGVLLIKSGELRTYILSEDGRDTAECFLCRGEVNIYAPFHIYFDTSAGSHAIHHENNFRMPGLHHLRHCPKRELCPC